jgi:hypothetical protein
MEPKYRTIIQAAVILAVIALFTLTIERPAQPEAGQVAVTE